MVVSKDEEKAFNKTQHHILKEKKKGREKKIRYIRKLFNTVKLTYGRA